MAQEFDPSEKGVDDVLKHLGKADREERDRVLAAEKSGKKRKTILEKYGIDADARYDATGRQLYPWEVTGDDMADAGQHPVETDEQRKAREAQAEFDTTVAATPQGGTSPAGSGVAPAAGTTGSTGTTTTTATAAGGATGGTTGTAGA